MLRSVVLLLAALFTHSAFAQNTRPVFPSTENKTTGSGIPLTSVVKGDTSSSVNAQMCLVGETSGGLLNSLLIDSLRQPLVNLRNSSGTEIGTLTNPVSTEQGADVIISTTATLGAAGVFTSSWVDIMRYPNISLTVQASHDSAALGVDVQFSRNCSAIGDSDKFTFLAGYTSKQWSFGRMFQCVRVVYTNGATPQTSFALTVLGSRGVFKPSSHRIADAVVDDDDAELTKSIITAEDEDGVYHILKSDGGGNLLVLDASEFDSATAFGRVDTSAAATFAVRKTTYNEQTTNARRSFSSASALDTSVAGTGARTLSFTYLAADGSGPFTETVSLLGVVCVATVASNIAFIEDAEVITVGSTGSNAGIITMFVNSTCGGGTVGTVAALDNRTLWAHHYVPTGVTANITGISGANNSTQAGNSAQFYLKSLPLAAANAAEIRISGAMRFFAQTSEVSRDFNAPIKIVGPARVTSYVDMEGGGSVTNFSSFDYYND